MFDSGSLASWSAAERAARESYGRLVAWLAYRARDLAAAEDALSDAFVAALTHWPRDGIPDSPDAWLIAVAKRGLLQRERRARLDQSPEIVALFDEEPEAPVSDSIPDRRLMLLFVCAHPVLPAQMHAPLMLQTVLGIDARTIADAFLVSPRAMAQRLVRAKAKLRDQRVRFEEPDAGELPERIITVLDSIYGAYAIGTNIARYGPAVEGTSTWGLSAEALYLARLTAQLCSNSAEAMGLLSLLLYCEARRPAQFESDDFVPLAEQDTSRWDASLITQAEACLRRASQLRQSGSFQLEAAIQSAHCQRAFTGHTPWTAIAHLYGQLLQHFPSIGARIGKAVALSESGAVNEGLRVLDEISAIDVTDHQSYWVARAHLHRLAAHQIQADAALQRAVGLTSDERVRRYLLKSSGLHSTRGQTA